MKIFPVFLTFCEAAVATKFGVKTGLVCPHPTPTSPHPALPLLWHCKQGDKRDGFNGGIKDFKKINH